MQFLYGATVFASHIIAHKIIDSESVAEHAVEADVVDGHDVFQHMLSCFRLDIQMLRQKTIKHSNLLFYMGIDLFIVFLNLE